jgi:hypothetical protein
MFIRILGGFVAKRFWIAFIFFVAYYGWIAVGTHCQVLRWGILAILLVLLGAGVLANFFMWIHDSRERLASGIGMLRGNYDKIIDKGVVEHVRWTNAKILAVLGLIIGLFSQLPKMEKVPSVHHVPLLAVLLLIVIALFDAALDLEAEWTICVLRAVRAEQKRHPDAHLTLPALIWATNQCKQKQIVLFTSVKTGEEAEIKFSSISATAQNLISFAVIVVFCMLAAMIALLLRSSLAG